MTLNLSLPQDPFDIRPKITVVGVGGAGGNAVNNMIRSKLEGQAVPAFKLKALRL